MPGNYKTLGNIPILLTKPPKKSILLQPGNTGSQTPTLLRHSVFNMEFVIFLYVWFGGPVVSTSVWQAKGSELKPDGGKHFYFLFKPRNSKSLGNKYALSAKPPKKSIFLQPRNL
jgi:hypothetical protein